MHRRLLAKSTTSLPSMGRPCGLSKSKQKAAGSVLHDCPKSEIITGSIPRCVIQGEPRVAADHGIADVEQVTEAAGNDVASFSQRDIENRSIFQAGNGRKESTVIIFVSVAGSEQTGVPEIAG